MLSIVRYLGVRARRTWRQVLHRLRINAAKRMIVGSRMVLVIPWWHGILILVSSCQIMLKVTTVWGKIGRGVSTKKMLKGKRCHLLLCNRVILRGR